MKYEVSAGGLVFLPTTNPSILLLKDKNGVWTFPKGLIEVGEDARVAAEREIHEETGVHPLKWLADLMPIQYYYHWEGDLIKKKVMYYLFSVVKNV
ncbi:MAG: NUDIX domain-containing protein, partial [Patescibacteria group bacterium]